jgi:hypothetical protein
MTVADEVLTLVPVHSAIFWGVTPRLYGGLRLSPTSFPFLASFRFDPEDGVSMFLRKMAGPLSDYMALHPSGVASSELEESGSVSNTVRVSSETLWEPLASYRDSAELADSFQPTDGQNDRSCRP